LTSTGAASGWFDGVIDEPRLWNLARSQPSIADDMLVEVDSTASGLKGRWGLNEGSGTTAFNVFGAGSDGTLTNGPLWVPGSPFDLSGALRLGASSAYTTFGDPAALDLAQFTIETWFRRDGAGIAATTGTGGINAIPLVSHGAAEVDASDNRDMNFLLGIRGEDGVLCADFEEGAGGASPGLNHPIVGVTPIATGVWHHAAVTYDGTTWRLYLDGVLENELTVGQPPRSDTIQHAALGTSLTSSGVAAGFFHGTLDEVRVWSFARSVAGIDSTINDRITAAQTGLVARWGLDEGAGSTVHGSAGTAVDGTISGSGWGWELPAPFDIIVGPPTPPAAPTDLSAAAFSFLQVDLGWTDQSNNETGFAIERSTAGPGGPFDPRASVGANVASWSDVGLEGSTEYCYRVRAVNSAGESDWTAPACATTPQEIEHALDFGGTNGYVTFGQAPALGHGEFTIETWFRRDDAGATANTGTGGFLAVPLVTKGVGEADGDTRDMNWFLGLSGDVLAADFEEGAGGTTPGLNHPIQGVTPVGTGTWHHAAATYDGGTWRLYLDGLLENELFVGQPPQANSIQHAALATALNSGGTASGWLDGALDEVRVWSHARTQNEISDAINERITATQPGLVGRWALNEGVGTVAHASAGTAVDGTILGTSWTWTDGAPFDLVVNLPPGAPAPVSPADGATGVAIPGTLDVVVSDPDGMPLDVTFYGRAETAASVSPFSIVLLPDTQYYSAQLNGGTAAMFRAQTDWIVAHRDSLDLAFVLHVGDIVEYGDQYADHWTNAWNAMGALEDSLSTGLPEGIPYSAALGNHDQSPNGDAAGTTTYYNQYFGTAHFAGRGYWGGSYGSNNDNHASFFSAGGLDFVVLTFEYDAAPDAPVLAWADSVLAAHPSRWAVVDCHNLAGTGNPASFSAQGQAVYDALKDRPNLFLMVGGHSPGEGRRTDTFQGSVTHTVVADYQSRANGGDGWLRVLAFDPAAGELRVRTFSPTLDQWETDTDSQFTLPIAISPAEDWEVIGTVPGVPSGSHATIDWAGLATLAEYEWYAEANDGTRVTAGPVWSFTTRSAPPSVQLASPNGGEMLTAGEIVSIDWSASDDVGVTSVDLWLSRDGLAGTWEALALGIPDTGSSDWEVTGPGTEDAWVKVVVHDADGSTAEDPGDAAFTIVDPTAAPVGLPAEFAFRVVSRQPLPGGGSFAISVPRETTLRLDLFDVSGRRLATLADGMYPAGVHTVSWDGRTERGRAAAGVYFLRLRAAEREIVRKVVVVF
jgi:hypothetical protein